MRAAARIPSALLRHELLLLAAIVRWLGRRPHGVGDGRQGFGYARGQGAMLFGFGFVCAIETAALSVLLRGFPLLHLVFLVVDLYTILMVVGLHASSVTRPHVLSATALRLRRFATVDLCVPLASVAAVHRELRTTHEKREGELDLVVGSQTSITLELAEPVTYRTLFGRSRAVRLVRFHADEPDVLVTELRQGLRPELGQKPAQEPGQKLGQELKPGRTAPSPLPDPSA
ncbi:hypothetical protein E0500_031305 [Streptomyces sp. KM273126]|uniref:hypothetical protein n=1 Tax=Streptomyces sp. KM273126 TaxID=2545247 RepID=UPI00103B0293|nr:hypothetical protein [Streptomyces sp. KM273126]MBA2811693.1 hypothetical protein [Streptomyces sp. KM273126]